MLAMINKSEVRNPHGKYKYIHINYDIVRDNKANF